MDEPQLPPIFMQKFNAFPDAKYLPKAVRADVAKLGALRTKALDAREAAHAALANISIVEDQVVKAAVSDLVAGKDARPDGDLVDQARRDFEQAVRTLKAIEGAIAELEGRLVILFRANVDESRELAAGVVESARADYLKALDAAADARRKFYEAASIEAFGCVFDGPREPAVVGYMQRVPDDAPWSMLRKELERPVIDTTPGPGLNARPHPPAADSGPGVPAGMRY